MPPHKFSYPKVVTVKATSPHRKTEVHQAVPRKFEDPEALQEECAPSSPPSPSSSPPRPRKRP